MLVAASQIGYERRCPACQQLRPAIELHCETEHADGAVCGWSLAEVDLQPVGATPLMPVAPPASAAHRCVNGHPLEAGDTLCLVCGGDPAIDEEGFSGVGTEPTAPPPPLSFDAWTVVEAVPGVADAPWEHFIVTRDGGGERALLTSYHVGFEPDPAVYETLARMPLDHIPELIGTGRVDGRAFEVVERIACGSLAEAGWLAADDPAVLTRIIDELGRALIGFAEVGLRHRDLRPGTVLLRTRDPLDLVVTGFGSARLSDFDLEAVAPLELTRYSAPETIVGAVSAASDWWSLGMILLEQVTAGACFAGVNEQAFRLHVVTRGISLPPDLDPRLAVLLQGLLTRDPLRRWAGSEVEAWLAGAEVAAPPPDNVPAATASAPIKLAGRSFVRPDLFALASAEAAHWTEARELTLRGAVATWLSVAAVEPRMAADVRRLTGDDGLSDDLRHALALMAMNAALPLTVAGEMVTPAWLLAHAEAGYALITGPAVSHLERMAREPWLVRLGARVAVVQERGQALAVTLDEDRLRFALLATSRANLDAERALLRRHFPDTDHPGLAALMERPRLSDEDVIILVSAAAHQFVPLVTLTEAAVSAALRAGVALDNVVLPDLLVLPRREIFVQVEARTANFARCGNEVVDAWADAYRVERRMPLDRAAALLAVAPSAWQEPPRQEYVATLLDLFEKRLSSAIGRGPLVRFVLGKTTPRLDLTELGSALRPAEALLNHVLSRVELKADIDRTAYLDDPARESRLRRLISHADTFRRDTGIDSRYLAFPFLMIRSGETTKPRLAPVLLWPVAIEWPGGAVAGPTLMFDRDREEVRLNPALESVLGPEAFARWRTARDELLAREAIRAGDVMDVFGSLANPRGRTLQSLPGKDAQAPPGATLLPAATLFNVEFTGQAVAGDLRQMRRRPPAGTALDATLRVSDVSPRNDKVPPNAELARFVTMESDPSQDEAVLRARQAPGLLVEGPPGTGKSQTIVNIISDAIGRGESVLVVCQKQAALRVVEKRLQAEKLGERLFLVGDINRDRAGILTALREQLTSARSQSSAAAVKRARIDKAARIEQLEGELDRYHEALHALDDRTGLSYRDLIGELLAVEAAGPRLDVPALRALLGSLNRTELAQIVGTCAPLVRPWLEANYEGNPLSALQSFAVDEAVIEAFAADLTAFAEAERLRDEIINRGVPLFDIEDPVPHRAWLATHAAVLRNLSEVARVDLRDWLDLFRPHAGAEPRGPALIIELERLYATLASLDPRHHETSLFPALAALDTDALALQLRAATVATTPATTVWQRMSLGRWRSLRRAGAFLAAAGRGIDDAAFVQLRDAAALEVSLRPLRTALLNVEAALGRPSEPGFRSLDQLRRRVVNLREALAPIPSASAAVVAASRPGETTTIVREATLAKVDALLAGFDLALSRHAAREGSQLRLDALSLWLQPAWLEERATAIRAHGSSRDALAIIARRLPELAAYQRFRARAGALPPAALDAFARLRPHAAGLFALPPELRSDAVERTLTREALLAWKTHFEGRWPELGLEREELSNKVTVLAALDAEMRDLNRELLTAIDAEQLGSATAWDAVTRLRGPRALRLREIIDQGAELGLMRLRPVWLMNPDVASRLLPLRAGLFDLVIFDEASQMPVEYAVPTLFRAKRTVISGDEKQMPPSSFFSSRAEEDEDDVDIGDIEDSTEAERSALEERWTRRDVQSCPDLLQLGRSALPVTSLQIHYRSAYRELIGYSNGGFYNNTLNVPARHPDDEVRRAAPIETIRVDGVYEDQTNPAEAAQVVTVLARLWASAPEQRPSIGVVTFNRKQADCVEKAILDRATDDASFRQALERERDRTQRGEDMGFFVKNVENVQGDERDVIIFSTTFGRDRRGTFRRNFGVLGQTGGERRLNVAVTRARSKVVLITSMPVKDVSDWLAAGRSPDKPRDYLQAYLDYATKVASGDLEAARITQNRLARQAPPLKRNGAAAMDGFAASVAAFVRSLGHEPVAAAQDGDAFGLDFAIEHPATGLFGIGIECDAPRHPLLRHARAREIWRPAVLGRSVPRLHRVSSAEWYTRRDEEEARLRQAIEDAVGRRAA